MPKTYEIVVGQRFEINDVPKYWYIGHKLWYCIDDDSVSELTPKLIKSLIKEKNGSQYYFFEDESERMMSREKIRSNYMKLLFPEELKDFDYYDLSKAPKNQFEEEKDLLSYWGWNVDDIDDIDIMGEQ